MKKLVELLDFAENESKIDICESKCGFVENESKIDLISINIKISKTLNWNHIKMADWLNKREKEREREREKERSLIK